MRTPKQHVELPNGKTMLETMLVFAQTTAGNTVVVGGDAEGVQSIHDHLDNQGPVAGIEALLHSGIDEHYLVVGCDMPTIQTANVQPLLECSGTALFQSKKKMCPLPLRIAAKERDRCTAYLQSGKRSIHGFIESIPHKSISIEPEQVSAFKSMNSPEDLANFFEQS
jgi:molybdopterin-guanine dinucleotide biosynthesis protein A